MLRVAADLLKKGTQGEYNVATAVNSSVNMRFFSAGIKKKISYTFSLLAFSSNHLHIKLYAPFVDNSRGNLNFMDFCGAKMDAFMVISPLTFTKTPFCII